MQKIGRMACSFFLSHSTFVLIFLLQVVLLTDGMDTRPYRLKWPASTIIFDISPDNVFKRAAEKLQGGQSLNHFEPFVDVGIWAMP